MPADAWGGSCSGSDPAVPEESLGGEYVQHMLGLLHSRRFNARELCTSMWWSAQNGVREVERYGLRPDARNGHYQRRLDPLAQHKAYSVALCDIEVPTQD